MTLMGQPAVVDILHAAGSSKKYVLLRPVAVMKGHTVKAARSAGLQPAGHLVAVPDKSPWPMRMRRHEVLVSCARGWQRLRAAY